MSACRPTRWASSWAASWWPARRTGWPFGGRGSAARSPPRRSRRRCRSGRKRRSTWGSGDRLARVLLHERADSRQRRRDVLGRAAADTAVGLDDHGPLGGRRPLIGHREQGLGHLVAALDQVVAEVARAGGA